MKRKQETKLELLYDKFIAPIVQSKSITNNQRRAIKSSCKSLAFEFYEQMIEMEYGKREPYYVCETDTLKQHAVKMCEMLSIDPHMMFSAKKGKVEVSTSRQVMMYLLRSNLGLRNTKDVILGRVFGKDRSTVIHSIKTAKTNIQIKDPLTIGILKVLKEYDFKLD